MSFGKRIIIELNYSTALIVYLRFERGAIYIEINFQSKDNMREIRYITKKLKEGKNEKRKTTNNNFNERRVKTEISG